MRENASAGLEARERLRQRLRTERVTAVTRRQAGGDTCTVYRAGGREYGSVDALAAGLGVIEA